MTKKTSTNPILKALNSLETVFDKTKNRIRGPVPQNQVQIVAYMGFGSNEKLFLQGRVLKDKNIVPATEDASLWSNIVSMYKRFQSREIPFALVEANLNGKLYTQTADEEGFFTFEFDHVSATVPEISFIEIPVRLVSYEGSDQSEDQEVTAVGRVLIPGTATSFGVISDVDDTVIQTNVVSLLAMARNTFFRNAHTRLPFEGVAEFYEALRRGKGTDHNPIFYVTSGAFNLYDMLIEFFNVRGIPVGPLFMTQMGLTREHLLYSSHYNHKFNTIQRLLDIYPHLNFILLGDSSQKDPEIYLEVIRKNPSRILAAYIRDVTSDKRDADIQDIIKQAVDLGAMMLYVPDTTAASIHAEAQGYITPRAQEQTEMGAEAEKEQPSPIEQAINPDSET